jgi:hypothetical protein
MRTHQKSEKQKRIVTYMQEIAGDDSVSRSPHVGEQDSDKDEQRDLQPASPELRRVHQPEERSSDQHRRGYSERPGQRGINVSSENRLLKERREHHTYHHQQKRAPTILKKHLNR